MSRLFRPILILGALSSLLAAMWAGLIRMGWDLPPLAVSLPMLHGTLMVNGFLGLMIGLERAAALSARTNQKPVYWPYLTPVALVLGTLVLFVWDQAGALLFTAGSLVMVAVFILIIRRQPASFTIVMGLGAVSWFIGNALWLAGFSINSLILWWIGFPLFTIIGERLELSRVLRPSKLSYQLFVGVCALFFIGALCSLFNSDLGARIAGLGEIACAAWLLRYDIARRTLRGAGLQRFIALCLFSGYAWLGVGGLVNLIFGVTYAGPFYDAALHSVFVGFVMSMILGHALIVLPAMLNLPVKFNPALYVSFVLLHSSLAIRIIGDLLADPLIRQWGGMLNVITLLIFLGTVIRVVMTARITLKTVPRPVT